jgi:hypothetical protein
VVIAPDLPQGRPSATAPRSALGAPMKRSTLAVSWVLLCALVGLISCSTATPASKRA